MEKRFGSFKCCNPFNKPRHNNRYKNLRGVLPWMVQRLPQISLRSKICGQCREQIRKLPGASSMDEFEYPEEDFEMEEMEEIEVDRHDQLFYQPNLALQSFNDCLRHLSEEEIDKKRISDKGYIRKKLKLAIKCIKIKIFNIVDDEEEDEIDSELYFVEKLKEKFQETDDKDIKTSILTLVPEDWSVKKIQDQFPGVTTYMVKKTKHMIRKQGILSKSPRKSRDPDTNLIDVVTAFYNSDDVSRIMPGKKDYISIKVDGERRQVQKRLLLGNLRELFCSFKDSNPDLKVGFSKFASLRPKNCILAGESGTHSVCVCSLHQNVKLMLEGVKKHCSNESRNSVILNYRNCIAMMLCNPPHINCFFRECCSCPGFPVIRENLEQILDKDYIDAIHYLQWINTDRSNIENVIESADTFIDTLERKLIQLLPHSFIAERQNSFLNELKLSLSVGEFLVIMDFSENYSFLVQDAVQSFHWNNSQATLHPCGIYYVNKDSMEVVHTNLIFISDCLSHNTVLVHVFQRYLVEFLRNNIGTVEKIFYFSDGSAAQYKNRKIFFNLTMHVEDFKCRAEWHFFATSHGKNICDGLGGTVKRLAVKASLQRPYSDQITTPHQLYSWAKENIIHMNFIYIPTEEYREEENILAERFLLSKPIPGTRNLHTVVPLEKGIVCTKLYSQSNQTTTYTVTNTK